MINCMMSFKFIVEVVLVLIYLLASVSHLYGAYSEFNVFDNGAKSDGKTDDSKAFLNAWKLACQSERPSTMVIPKGNYMLGSVVFEGPCKAAITIRVQGILKAPSSLEAFRNPQDGWIGFKNIDRLTVMGGGTFDGQGSITWKNNNCANTGICNLPTNIRFTGITNGLVHDITSIDSKMFHINILNCENLNLKEITIDASMTSLNTDGIHIGRSNRVNITNTMIKTGDDCISLGDGSQHVNIEKVTCGLGHGISIGSLGKYHDEQPVLGINVRNCTLTNTTNGLRIKTWPNSFNGVASGLHFEDILMNNVSNPIIIDQNYCPSNLCKHSVPSRVRISDVLFKNIKGTSATKVALQLRCSKSAPCQNVKLTDIGLKYMMTNGRIFKSAISQCSNVKPSIRGQISPPPCLTS